MIHAKRVPDSIQLELVTMRCDELEKLLRECESYLAFGQYIEGDHEDLWRRVSDSLGGPRKEPK